jgi:DNA-binding NtrC family response regulator
MSDHDLIPPPPPGGSGDDRPAPAAARPTGLLVIDDQEGVRWVLDAGMRYYGFDVWQAADGAEAVQVYWLHRERIDVVLLDVRMPSWDGPRTLAALREISPEVRCCFMTGDPGGYTEQDLLGLGALAVIRKPFRLSEVAEQLAELTAAGARDDALQEARWSDDGGQGATSR